MSRVARILVALALASPLFAACDKARPGRVQNPFAPAALEVLLDQRVVGRFTTPTGSLTLHARSSTRTYELMNRLEVRVATPCGMQTVTEAYPMHEDSGGFHIDVSQSYFRVFVDNRGGPARTLALGELSLPIAAGSIDPVEIYLAGCRAPIAVSLDGAPVGEIDRIQSIHTVVVDPAGARCYRVVRHEYSVLAPMGIGRLPEGHVEGRSRVHMLEQIVDHILEPAPHSVQSYTMMNERTEVLETGCED